MFKMFNFWRHIVGYTVGNKVLRLRASNDIPPEYGTRRSGLEVIKLEYSLRLKIKRNDWLHADKCPQAANCCTLF